MAEMLDAFSWALTMAQKNQTEKRLQEHAQQQAIMQQMQMMKLAAELQGMARQQQQEQGIASMFTPQQQPSTFRETQAPDPYGLSGGPVSELIPGRMGYRPEAQGVLSQYAPEARESVAALMRGGKPGQELINKLFQRQTGPKNLENLLTESVQRGEEPSPLLVNALKMKRQQEGKEVNVANEIDTVLGGMFPGYYTDPAKRQQALAYYSTPEGSKAVQSKAQQYAQGKAAPIYNIMPGYQSPEGQPVTVNVRSGKIPQGLQKTPSESDVSAARTKGTITAIIDEIDSAFDRAEKSLPSNATERVSGYATRIAKLKTQSDPNLVLADSLSQGFLAKFARAAGEVGVLTDRDIERAQKLAVNIHDTPQVRKGKLNGIKSLFNEIYERGKRQENPLGARGAKPSLDEIFKGQ